MKLYWFNVFGTDGEIDNFVQRQSGKLISWELEELHDALLQPRPKWWLRQYELAKKEKALRY